MEVTAVSAVALDESARSRLQEKLQRVTGKTITLTEKVDPSVLGGRGWILAEPAWTALCRAGWNVCAMKSAVW